MAEENLGSIAQLSVAIIAVTTAVVAAYKSMGLNRHVRDNLKEQSMKIDVLALRQAEVEKLMPLHAEKYSHIAETCETLAEQNKEIFALLTDMRSEQIRELKEKVKTLESTQ